uniref:Plasminogen receptor (KT) n=1 Tax=Strongyloides papillosus TaxID=174720 RepID=A0A0N5C198_STREA
MFSYLFGKNTRDDVNEELVKRIVQELEDKKIEREIALKEAFMERENAYKLAKMRESIFWTVPSGLFVSFVSIFSTFHSKNPLYLAPLGPVIGYLGYQYNSAFGKKNEHIIRKASEILMNDSDIAMKLKPITLEEVRNRISENNTN